METLDVYSIRFLIQYLDLKSQIALVHINDQYYEAISRLWRLRYRRLSIHFVESTLTDREYEVFFDVIKDFIEVLDLRFMDERKYELLKTSTYPHVKTLRLSLHPIFMTDKDVLDLFHLFPSLTIFVPNGNLTGKYLDLWVNLKDLTLTCCYLLEVPRFHRIMEVLVLEELKLNIFPLPDQFDQLHLPNANLKELRYLRLNTYELYYFLNHPLPNLKDLIVANLYNPRQLFDVLLSTWQANDIRKLETTNVENVLANCLEMRMDVEEICIIGDKNAMPPNVVRSLHTLTNLRQLRIKNCKLYSVNIMQLLKSLPQADVVSIEECRLVQSHVVIDVMELAATRTKVIRLNFFDNEPRSLRNEENYDYINVSIEWK